MYRKSAIAGLFLSLCVSTGLWAYYTYLRSYRVALVHFDDTDWAMWSAAGDQTPYSLYRFDRDEIDTIPYENYNLVVIRAMGLNLSDEQVTKFDRARASGTEFLIILPTSQRSREQTSFTDEQKETIDNYLRHGGEDNLVSMLHYTARETGARDVDVPPLIEKPLRGFFHHGDAIFETLEEYETFLRRERPNLSADAPRITLAGPFVDPHEHMNRAHIDHFIRVFESSGAIVYPMFGYENSMQLLESTRPDLIITFPHGRMAQGSEATDLLSQLDCPIVSALSLMSDEATWMADQRGLSAGFLGQSVVTPEIDGVIEPIVITSVDPNERNIGVRTIIDDRIERRADRVLKLIKLRKKANSEKRVVIVYYKGPGMAALAASNLEVVPSLFNTLKRMQAEGYDLGDEMPETPEDLFHLIQTKGKTLGQWAIGSYEKFLADAEPEFVPARQYAGWFRDALSPKRQQETIDLWGAIPGKQMVTEREDEPYLVVSRIKLGNVVIMPQPTVGGGGEDEDEVASIHGTDQAAPHFYLGAYLWARHGFDADAIVHYGTHGSLEFTYGKSNCLSRDCWPDILIGDLPHIYPYVINNVGEAVIAKRRSNAVIISHLTAPFTESSLYGDLSILHDKIHDWESADSAMMQEEVCRSITSLVASLNMEIDLGITPDELQNRLLTETEIDGLHNYIHQLKNQSITDGLHVIGEPYGDEQIAATVTAMLAPDEVDAVLAANGLLDHAEAMEFRSELIAELVTGVLNNKYDEEGLLSESLTGQLRGQLRGQQSAEQAAQQASPMHGAGRPISSARPVKPSAELEETQDEPAIDQTLFAELGEIDPETYWSELAAERMQKNTDSKLQLKFLESIEHIREFAENLRSSPEVELDQFIVALRGGYIEPSSGGDPILNPTSVPTGRNLYAINAELAPSEEAWRVGCRLADGLLKKHKLQNGAYPRRVAFSLWGGEFIRGKGTTMAQVLYLMGVRPMRNSRGMVYDVEVIDSQELGRPRIDVLVQTSGQFRDIAASRISLMDKAVLKVAALEDEAFPNFVRDHTLDSELELKEQGMSPKEARLFATARIFGAANNRSYGTGIMGLVEKGDTWEDEKQIADRYIENMGGIYRDGDTWGTYKAGVFAAQMKGTEMVIQPRSSNTWGPLSLDHVYEFMGGMSLAVRNQTGNDPATYFNDLRTRGRAKSTTAVAAIREEARTTIWNPKFIEGMQKEGASAASVLTESVRNMHGWNVMQPSSISQDMWDETYSVYIEDKHQLGMREYFETKNPYALQNMTAIMLETARKGYWTPPQEVLEQIAGVHAELVDQFGAGCSYETCGNGKLQEFLKGQLMAPGSQVLPELVAQYQSSLSAAVESSVELPNVEGISMEERTEPSETKSETPTTVRPTLQLASGLVLGILVLLVTGMWRE